MRLTIILMLSAALYAADKLPADVVRSVALAQRDYLAAKSTYDAAVAKAQAAYSEAQAACSKADAQTMFDANGLECVDGKAFCSQQGMDFADGKCAPRKPEAKKP